MGDVGDIINFDWCDYVISTLSVIVFEWRSDPARLFRGPLIFLMVNICIFPVLMVSTLSIFYAFCNFFLLFCVSKYLFGARGECSAMLVGQGCFWGVTPERWFSTVIS